MGTADFFLNHIMKIAIIILSAIIIIYLGFLLYHLLLMRYNLRKCSFVQLMEIEKDLRSKYDALTEKQRQGIDGKMIVSVLKSVDKRMKVVAGKI